MADMPAPPNHLSLVRTLLSFLDSKFDRFNPLLQNVIGFTVIGLLFIYILHGFVAPTFIRGRIWIRTENGSGYATDYRVEYNGNDYPVSSFGYWVVPVYHGGIPGRLRVQILNAQRELVERFTIIGPLPAWHALFEMYYECEIELSKPIGQRLKWVRNRDAIPSDVTLGSVAVARADTEPALTAESPQRAGAGWRVAQLQAQPLAVLVLNSVDFTMVPSRFRSRASQVYFSIHSNNQPINDLILMGLAASGAGVTPVSSWTPAGQNSASRFRFPLSLFRESWLPVWQERRPLYGIAANVTSLVDLEQHQIRPKGIIELAMHSPEQNSPYDPLAKMDITRAFQSPGQRFDLKDVSPGNYPGPEVSVTVLRSFGFPFDASR